MSGNKRDILESLRIYADGYGDPIFQDAANEIKHLRETQQKFGVWQNELLAEMEALEEEVALLRDKLATANQYRGYPHREDMGR